MGNEDVETGFFGTDVGPFSEKAVRMAFVRKVYSILSIQLIATFIPVIALTVYRIKHSQEVLKYLGENMTLVYVMFGVSAVFMIVLSIMLSCCENVRRTHPWNLICLGLYTLCTTVLVTFATVAYDTNSVAYAAGFTAAITIGLTIFAMQTKIDFTIYYQLAFVLLLCLCLFGFTFAFTSFAPLQRVYAAFGALLFSFFIVIDTQLILGGGRFQLSPEEYVLAALTLYMDIINLFLKLLQLIGRR